MLKIRKRICYSSHFNVKCRIGYGVSVVGSSILSLFEESTALGDEADERPLGHSSLGLNMSLEVLLVGDHEVRHGLRHSILELAGPLDGVLQVLQRHISILVIVAGFFLNIIQSFLYGNL